MSYLDDIARAPVYELSEAAQVLRSSYSNARYHEVNQRLIDNVDQLRSLLAVLLKEIQTDWLAANGIRKVYAGTEAPHGKVERAAYSLSLLALGIPEEEKEPIPKDPRDQDEPTP